VTGIDELTALVLRLALTSDAEAKLENTIAYTMLESKKRHNIPDTEDGEPFPEHAYQAAASLLMCKTNDLGINAVKKITKLIKGVADLADNLRQNKAPTRRQVKKLVGLLAETQLATLFLSHVTKSGLTLVDWDHVADTVIAQSLRRVKEAETAPDKP
jgi:hypothetical protein